MAKSKKLGGGGRFQALTQKLEKQGKSAAAAKDIAGAIGIKKYGQKKMTSMAAAGRKRAAKRKG